MVSPTRADLGIWLLAMVIVVVSPAARAQDGVDAATKFWSKLLTKCDGRVILHYVDKFNENTEQWVELKGATQPSLKRFEISELDRMNGISTSAESSLHFQLLRVGQRKWGEWAPGAEPLSAFPYAASYFASAFMAKNAVGVDFSIRKGVLSYHVQPEPSDFKGNDLGWFTFSPANCQHLPAE